VQIPSGFTIKTKYSGATSFRAHAVIIATLKRDRETTWKVFIGVDNALSDEQNHLCAANKLLRLYLPQCEVIARGFDRDYQYFIAVNKCYVAEPSNG
jgi:hypothetical protein